MIFFATMTSSDIVELRTTIINIEYPTLMLGKMFLIFLGYKLLDARGIFLNITKDIYMHICILIRRFIYSKILHSYFITLLLKLKMHQNSLVRTEEYTSLYTENP